MLWLRLYKKIVSIFFYIKLYFLISFFLLTPSYLWTSFMHHSGKCLVYFLTQNIVGQVIDTCWSNMILINMRLWTIWIIRVWLGPRSCQILYIVSRLGKLITFFVKSILLLLHEHLLELTSGWFTKKYRNFRFWQLAELVINVIHNIFMLLHCLNEKKL